MTYQNATVKEPTVTSHASPPPASDHPPAGPELEELQAEFPGYRIWRGVTGEHTRLIVAARTPGASPHTVVTADIAELRDALHGPAGP